MKQIKELIERHTTEEGIDYDALTTDVNQEINNIVAKNTTKAEQNVFKTLELEGVTDKESLSNYINALKEVPNESLTELQTKYTEAEKVLNEKEAALSELNLKVSELSKKEMILQQERLLLEQGITDADDRDYLLYNVSKLVTEEVPFEQAWEVYKEQKADKLNAMIQTPVTQTTGTKIRGGNAEPTLSGVKALLRERNKEVFND